MRSFHKRDVKKKVLIFLDIIFGVYIINTKIPFLGVLDFAQSIEDVVMLVSGILLILNFFYLIFFSRRVKFY
ncbi:hypothetical protein COU58_04435 [Candidatus Pacearchaeota archaeon CG10_big_fil_rev_8_21_14_0_10_32_42]|nr:MAG: hypothetical protein COU58_04435 [Candidatus Pacearchaeota archaeon CG10_big_fil_rev_8_21_14_0_10_32_42]